MSRTRPSPIDGGSTPRLTIVVEGDWDIHRFAYNLLDDQSEFAEMGRKILKSQRRRIGRNRWRHVWRILHGNESTPMTFHWGRDL
jgi:hypothetical protein